MTIHIESMPYAVYKVYSMEEAIKSTQNECVKEPAVSFERGHLHIDRKLPFSCSYPHVMFRLNKKAFRHPQKPLRPFANEKEVKKIRNRRYVLG